MDTKQRYEITQTIDGKASTLLTHLSIMTAVASMFFLEAKADPFYRTVFLGEIAAYVAISLLTFLALGGVRGGPSFAFREAVLGFCYGAAALATLVLLATVVGKFILT